MNGYADPDPENLGDGAVYGSAADPAWREREERDADMAAAAKQTPAILPVFDALPTSLVCVHCRFEVSADDVALPLRSGVICAACYARVTGDERHMSKRLRQQVEQAAGQ